MTKVKKSVVSRRSLFPVGEYRGEVTAPAEVSEEHGWLQYNPEGTIGNINFQLTNNTLVEGETEPGARRCFMRIPVFAEVEVEDDRGRKTKQTYETVDVANDEAMQEDDNVPFMIRDAVATIAQLAAALGVATVTDEGIEDFDAEEFIEALKRGEYEGSTVDFKVTHRFSKKAKRSFEAVDFIVPEPGEGGEEPTAAAEPEEEETEEVMEEEEETPTPTPARKVTRAAPTKAKPAPKAAPKGSGKGKFTRKR